MTVAVWQAASLVFLCGLAMLLLRAQLMAMLLGLELMLAAANLLLAYHAAAFDDPRGLAAAVLILGVGAAEAVLGLALILALRRSGVDPESPNLTAIGD